ncbi:uncharacterized protein DUF2029 [Kribbella amoyensis]|uniref:Uncharacterized protein DUF2029 n=1 Tax=Kribbella amoyensis TaxID=996641 RepID=A0A561C059_9ACTN|nr:glycosyltransferase 87 family protein [Kribbella amoyensis]TWD84543.1 uncharacterized protein DUF2029 [Kribbella amoyensis]
MTRQARSRPASLAAAGSVAVLASAATVVTAAHRWWPNVTLLFAVLTVGAVAWLVTRTPQGPRALPGLLVVAAACQVPGLLSAPITSTDAYRYVWDGRVQLSGSSPYSHVPLDDALADLRDPVLFPGLSPADRSWIAGPPRVPDDPTALAALSADDPRTRINRPRVPTIYPPVAQAFFAAVALVTPWPAGTFGLQLAAAILAVMITALLINALRRSGRDPRWAVLWGWSPIVALEAGNAAHVDVLAAAFVVGAVVVATRSRPLLAGLLLGAAAAVKLLPMLLIPAFVRRGGMKTSLATVGTFLTSYVPHLLAAGTLVLGFLPGYLGQEGFSDGRSRSALLALVLPAEARQVVVAVTAAGLALVVILLRDRVTIAVASCWLYGGALLLTTPTYPWYGIPLIALAVLAQRYEWIAVPLAAYLAYAGFGHDTRQGLAYLGAGAVVLIASLVRRTAHEHRLPRQPAT